jgi:hypothetical protein
MCIWLLWNKPTKIGNNIWKLSSLKRWNVFAFRDMSVMYMKLAPFWVFEQHRLVAGVSRQPVCPVCKFQEAQQFFLDCLTLTSVLTTILGFVKSHKSAYLVYRLHRGWSLWSHTFIRTFVSFKDAYLRVRVTYLFASSVAFTLHLGLQNNPK